MGFAPTMNAILEQLPSDRQTLLFSATQTRNINDLARCSLQNPKFISVDENAQFATPDKLTQTFSVVHLSDKIDVFWSFVRNHKRKKILVFVQSCKQARFMTEISKRLRIGLNVLGLYGTLHQLRRMAIYQEFIDKDAGVLIATDLAARGLDFPKIDWVFQLDCPEDAKTYLHRVGRTARHVNIGQSILILTPQEEEGMLKQLKAHKVPIEEYQINPNKMSGIRKKIECSLAGDSELKEMATRAFQSYIKSIYLMKNKVIFDAFKIDLNKFAESLGLVVTPRVRFLQKQIKLRENTDDKKSSERPEIPLNKLNNKITFNDSSDDDEEDDILTMKRKDHDLEEDGAEITEEHVPGFGQKKNKAARRKTNANYGNLVYD